MVSRREQHSQTLERRSFENKEDGKYSRSSEGGARKRERFRRRIGRRRRRRTSRLPAARLENRSRKRFASTSRISSSRSTFVVQQHERERSTECIVPREPHFPSRSNDFLTKYPLPASRNFETYFDTSPFLSAYATTLSVFCNPSPSRALPFLFDEPDDLSRHSVRLSRTPHATGRYVLRSRFPLSPQRSRQCDDPLDFLLGSTRSRSRRSPSSSPRCLFFLDTPCPQYHRTSRSYEHRSTRLSRSGIGSRSDPSSHRTRRLDRRRIRSSPLRAPQRSPTRSHPRYGRRDCVVGCR